MPLSVARSLVCLVLLLSLSVWVCARARVYLSLSLVACGRFDSLSSARETNCLPLKFFAARAHHALSPMPTHRPERHAVGGAGHAADGARIFQCVAGYAADAAGQPSNAHAGTSNAMWRKLFYSGFETCFGPSTQGAETKTHLKSRFCAILKKRGAM